MPLIGKSLILIGSLLIALGVLFLFQEKVPFLSRLGKLPGDIRIERENFSFYFPLATCLLISMVLTILGLLYNRYFKS